MDFGSRYQAETAEMYPHTGPGREFFDQVISAGAGMLPSVIGNALVPGSGLYISMMLSMSSAFAEAVERGADEASALAYCVSVGIAGALVEKLTDGLGGLFGRSGLSELLNDALSEALGNPAAREGFIFLAGMAGEGFEEFLSVFAEELMRVNLLGTEARSREEQLGDAKRSFFVSALVSGLVQGAAKLGSLGVDADPAELGRLYADETAAGFYGKDAELYGPADVELYEPTDVELYGPETDVTSGMLDASKSSGDSLSAHTDGDQNQALAEADAVETIWQRALWDYNKEILQTIRNGDINTGDLPSRYLLVKNNEDMDIIFDVQYNGQQSGRPSWQQSERDVAEMLDGFERQKSFLDRLPVKYSTAGSVRPDYYKPGVSVEVKNYNALKESNVRSMLNRIAKQHQRREYHLPLDTKQFITVDIRGQNLTDEQFGQLHKRLRSTVNSETGIAYITGRSTDNWLY